MRKLNRFSIVLTLVSAVQDVSPATEMTSPTSLVSQYTKLTRPPCRTTGIQAEGGNSEQVCPGILGYKLLLLDSDGRMSVTLVTPDGSKRPLDFWKNVTPHFSKVGNWAEWRIRRQGTRKLPVAVILPLEVKEDPASNAVTKYLVVSKIDQTSTCVVQEFKQTEDSLAKARRAADSASDRTCQTRN
jgi:hypothetical protein